MFRPIQRCAARHLQHVGRTRTPFRAYASAAEPFDWKDPLKASNLFTEDEMAIAETAESYCQEQLLPRVLGEARTLPPRTYLIILTDRRGIPSRAL